MATTATSRNGASTAPAAVVQTFLGALADDDVDRAAALLADDAVWINVSLPAVRGRARIERLCRMGPRIGLRFRVHVHHLAAEGPVVLTERSDALGLGRFEQRFWVHGRFEVHDGRITVWRDAFDWGDLGVSLVRGLAGIAVPGLNRPWPGRH
ncbi:MAG TPA: limonene-1,2-epoxide hydrolase family protein [Baekduia sp.]|nr:limonene-1,2-epoxide hydrolase family protein [Baekduia sp.]